jgi:hypothetical protein
VVVNSLTTGEKRLPELLLLNILLLLSDSSGLPSVLVLPAALLGLLTLPLMYIDFFAELFAAFIDDKLDIWGSM